MANPVWPSSLPQYVEVDGFDGKLPNAVVATPMDAGPTKVRRRFTAAPEPLRFRLFLEGTQRDTFRTFFKDTCQMGALPFDWVHPITRAAATLRFKPGSPPDYQPLGGPQEYVTIEAEVLP